MRRLEDQIHFGLLHIKKSHRPSHHADVMTGPSLLVELAHLCLFHLRCQDGAPLDADVALSPYLQTERFSYAVASGDACKQFEIQRRGRKGRSDAIASLLMLPFSELMPTGGVEMCRTIAIELCCSRTVLHAKYTLAGRQAKHEELHVRFLLFRSSVPNARCWHCHGEFLKSEPQAMVSATTLRSSWLFPRCICTGATAHEPSGNHLQDELKTI